MGGQFSQEGLTRGDSHTSHRDHMKTLVVGIGNLLASDDAAGVRVAEQVRERLGSIEETEVVDGSLSGLGLIELMSGYERVIVIDSIQTGDGRPGTIHRMSESDLPAGRSPAILHDMSLRAALDLGRRLGLDMPRDVILYAIEAEDLATFCDECTPEVKKAIPAAVKLVLEELKRRGTTGPWAD